MWKKILFALFVIAVLAIVASLQIPSGKFPIRTGEEIKDYAYEVLGLPCEGENVYYESSINYTDQMEPDEFGYYGLRATSVIDGKVRIVGYITFAECRVVDEYYPDGRPKKGTFLWRLYFDPNNGWIQQETCNWERLDNCPKDENGEYIWINRDFKENPDYQKYLQLISCDPDDRECWAQD